MSNIDRDEMQNCPVFINFFDDFMSFQKDFRVSRFKNIHDFAWKTFTFWWFRIPKGRNFRENDQKTQKTRKLMPVKVSVLKVTSIWNLKYFFMFFSISVIFHNNWFISKVEMELTSLVWLEKVLVKSDNYVTTSKNSQMGLPW